MKNALRKFRHAARNRYTQAGVAITTLTLAGTASATTTPAGGATAIAALESEAQSMIDAAWPVAVTIVGAVVGLKLFKKFANRAS